MFKAKNISIKRSKTKLEQGLPIPNLNNFKNKEKKAILGLIKILSTYLVKTSNNLFNKNTESFIDKILKSNNYTSTKYTGLNEIIIRSIEKKDRESIKNVLNQLFFQLFNLDEDVMNNLLIEYYDL